MKVILGSCLTTTLLLIIGCNGQPSPTENVDQYIDSSITGIERQEISSFIRSLPLNARANVVLFPDSVSGQIFVNKPSLRSQFTFTTSSEQLNLQQDKLFPQAQGTPACKPQRDPRLVNGQSAGNNGGIFYRVLSDSGYKAAQMDIQLPASELVRSGEGLSATNDTPYIYFGGWGNGERPEFTTYGSYGDVVGADLGSAVDFGLKHNRLTNRWAIFGLFQGPSGSGLERIEPSPNGSFSFYPNETVQMKFGVTNIADINYLALYVETLIGNTINKISVGRKAVGSLRDWKPTAPNMRIKRAVSIAQITPANDSYGFVRSDAYLKNVRLTNFKRTTINGQESTGWSGIFPCRIPDNVGTGSSFTFLPNTLNAPNYPNPFYYSDLIPRINGDTIELVTNSIFLTGKK